MAIHKFNNIKSLFAYMDNKIKRSLDDIGKEVMAKLRYNVNHSVYDWTPARYERTRQVLESISRLEAAWAGGRYVAEVYFDPMKIRPIIQSGKWNAHASFGGRWAMGDIAGSNLIAWLERGTPDNPYFQHEAHGFIKETVGWIEGEYLMLFRRELEKNSVPCK